ncbi:bacitracin ABC transporter ATP-binding protein [Neobacillus sp. 179-J 1A1 HS]
MSKKKKPLLTDEFLDELANEINELYGRPVEQNEDETNHKKEDN